MGWKHSRLIQWLVLLAVVHPGQHFPPQTFLLWGHRHRVRYEDTQGGAPPRALPPTPGRTLSGWEDRPACLGRPPGLGQALWGPVDLTSSPHAAIPWLTPGDLTLSAQHRTRRDNNDKGS